MKDKKKLIRNLIVFCLLIILTFYMILKDEDLFAMFNIIKNANIGYLLIAVLCMCVYIVLEGVNIRRTLRKLGEQSSFWQNVKYSCIGFFFSSITPAASGGQPMQIYYMKKDKLSVANSTLALLINLTSMQIVTISLALISVIFNYQYLNGPLAAFCCIGIMLNISALSLLLISIISKRSTNWLINVAIKIMKFFRVKNIEDKQAKLKSELGKYQKSAKYLKENRGMLAKTIIITLIQFLFYYGITYFVVRALGVGEEHNIFKIISMQSLVYATVSGIPSPGAIGVSEGAFIEIFKHICPVGIINSMVILNRGVNFYLFVLISAIVVIVNDLRKGKTKKRKD